MPEATGFRPDRSVDAPLGQGFAGRTGFERDAVKLHGGNAGWALIGTESHASSSPIIRESDDPAFEPQCKAPFRRGQRNIASGSQNVLVGATVASPEPGTAFRKDSDQPNGLRRRWSRDRCRKAGCRTGLGGEPGAFDPEALDSFPGVFRRPVLAHPCGPGHQRRIEAVLRRHRKTDRRLVITPLPVGNAVTGLAGDGGPAAAERQLQREGSTNQGIGT